MLLSKPSDGVYLTKNAGDTVISSMVVPSSVFQSSMIVQEFNADIEYHDGNYDIGVVEEEGGGVQEKRNHLLL